MKTALAYVFGVCVFAALYGYWMRFLRDVGDGSMVTAGAPIAKRIAPYALVGAIISGTLLLIVNVA